MPRPPRTIGFLIAFSLIALVFPLALPAESTDTAALPELTAEAAAPVQADWLVAPVDRKTGVYRVPGRPEIVMTNGLVSRTWRLEPNAATVGFDNLVTGESILRGVKPEALVQIDGIQCEVGGLKGQPNYAYLLPEWIDALTADPRAFQFVGFEVGPTQERLAWKRCRYAADLPWPPPGASLRLDFQAGPELAAELVPGQNTPSGQGRELLLSDNFESLDPAWELHLSKQENTTFQYEGKTGVIGALTNTCAYAERHLPAGTRLVECKVECGTDASSSWGPGITLVWPGRVIQFQLRPGQNGYGIIDNGRVQQVGQIDPAKNYYLRMRIDGPMLYCESSMDGDNWTLVGRVAIGPDAGDPQLLRLGKTSQSGGDDDYAGEPGERGRCAVGELRVYGDLTDEARRLQTEQLAFLQKITVSVHYEMYDGIPLLCKWITVQNDSGKTIRLNTFTSEQLAVVEYQSSVEEPERWEYPNLHVESDYAMHGMDAGGANETTFWMPDPQYETQVNYVRKTPVLLESRPPIGPDVDIKPGATFESFRTFELVFDSTERERRGLAQRRMYRTIAPWSTENPILMHVRSANPDAVRLAIDQCADVGFEMVIMTFGSGFNIENVSPEYMASIKELVDYAHGKGIELGGYSLLASRRVSDADDVINPATGRPGGAIFGNSPCLESDWGRQYFDKLYTFIDQTGLDLLEHDGSYPGDLCASTTHPGHRGLTDSQWTQWRKITDLYKWCRARGTYLNVPDWYFLTGSNKTAMGYRETNWSLPRAQQVIHGRQNMFDGTWEKTPSMGWMFVPLVQYHGGGAAATIEPLREHLDTYETILAQNFGYGVQACYRGPRLYDADETRAVVKKWTDFYRAHREVLDADLLHLRRADGRDLDYVLHVNPTGEEKGLLMVFNPLDRPVSRTLTIPLYYTGLTETASIAHENEEPKAFTLDRRYNVQLPVEVPARGVTWYVITSRH